MTVPPAELLLTSGSREGSAADFRRLNIAEGLTVLVMERPQQPAVLVPHAEGWRASVTFAELDALSNRYANVLAAAGIEPGGCARCSWCGRALNNSAGLVLLRQPTADIGPTGLYSAD